ncbi:MAG: ABC transporter ATP-binding protein [Marmoricola sp.]
MSAASSVEDHCAYRLDGVSKVYGGDRGGARFVALRDVSLRIPEGAYATVVGPSGSGKSTLLGLLGLLDQPSSGTICVAGWSMSEANEKIRCRMRAQHLAFVFQAFHLMQHRTVLDNVMLGGLYRGLDRGERRAQAHARLAQVGLSAKADKRAGTLSGGERQRTAIARALLGSPSVLLCDEPTGNLDSANGRAVVALLGELHASGITIVLVTHDEHIAAQGDHRISVVDGQVRGDGCA